MAFTCCLAEPEKKAVNHSNDIDKQLQKDKIQQKNEVKILLLGAGESGKSTFLKQMKIIHGQKFSEEEVREYRVIIYGNIIKGVKVLADARDKLDIPWGNPLNVQHANFVMSHDNTVPLEPSVFVQYVQACKELWRDSGIQHAFDRRREFHLADSVKYFLDEISRIGVQDYIPSEQDILYARKATKGIHEHCIKIKGASIRFVDVGGQRSQRQKWFQCFDNVTSILFLASCSEFDEVSWEDRINNPLTNRLIESCIIFETIVNHKCFADIPVLLFLNKEDLLEEKIKTVSIKDYFPNFQDDPHDLKKVKEFIMKMFDVRRTNVKKAFYYYFTTAVNTENIKYVFGAVKDIIITGSMNEITPY